MSAATGKYPEMPKYAGGPRLAATPGGWDPKVVVFACNWCSYTAALQTHTGGRYGRIGALGGP